MHFLRVEVVLQAATYFVVFTDADTMPPPVRINNFSQVAIQFFQVSIILNKFSNSILYRSIVLRSTRIIFCLSAS